MYTEDTDQDYTADDGVGNPSGEGKVISEGVAGRAGSGECKGFK